MTDHMVLRCKQNRTLNIIASKKEGLSSFHLASTFGLCTICSTIESCTCENFDCKRSVLPRKGQNDWETTKMISNTEWCDECCWHSCSIDVSCICTTFTSTNTDADYTTRQRWTAILKAVALMHHRRAKHTCTQWYDGHQSSSYSIVLS